MPDVASFDESWCKEQRAERAFANAIIAGGLKRNPKGVYERIAHVARSFTENGRYSAEEGSAAVDQLLKTSWKRTASRETNPSIRKGGHD